MGLVVMVATAVAYLVNSRLGALLLLLAAAYYLVATKGSLYERLLRVIVYSAAYYTFDIFGGRQRLSVCIVAIAALCVLLTFNTLKRGAKVTVGSAYKLILLLFFVTSYFLSVVASYDPKETIFATYHLVILAFLLFIVPTSRNEELKDIDTIALLNSFVRGVCAVAITLYVQFGAKTIWGISLGEVYEYNSNRIIYNVYFYSKSVLSLYVATGMLYFFIEYVNNKKLNSLIWLGFFAGAILINNSRTGLVCFAICAVIYCLQNARKTISSIRVSVVLILIGAVSLYIIQLMLESRSNLESFTDDNGRMETIIEAFRLLPQYVFSGIGGSAADFVMSSMGISVHNFFVSYLIQFGIFGGLAVNALLLEPVLVNRNKYWYLLCCVVIGGMFFANWHNVLYIVPVYLCNILEQK